eukprot:Seg3562.8 transcript_id=Seg3562.8/GoldUCD/mRNA.D3Y31 product="hypothetical protein" protein_id=Seg3562.8/GoldUCD/D3Y31
MSILFVSLEYALQLYNGDCNFPKTGDDIDDYANARVQELVLCNSHMPVPEHVKQTQGGANALPTMLTRLKQDKPEKPRPTSVPYGATELEKQAFLQRQQREYESACEQYARNVGIVMNQVKTANIEQAKYGLKHAICQIINNQEHDPDGNPLPHSLIARMHFNRKKRVQFPVVDNNNDEDNDDDDDDPFHMPPRKKRRPDTPRRRITINKKKATKKKKAKRAPARRKKAFILDEAEEGDDDTSTSVRSSSSSSVSQSASPPQTSPQTSPIRSVTPTRDERYDALPSSAESSPRSPTPPPDNYYYVLKRMQCSSWSPMISELVDETSVALQYDYNQLMKLVEGIPEDGISLLIDIKNSYDRLLSQISADQLEHHLRKEVEELPVWSRYAQQKTELCDQVENLEMRVEEMERESKLLHSELTRDKKVIADLEHQMKEQRARFNDVIEGDMTKKMIDLCHVVDTKACKEDKKEKERMEVCFKKLTGISAWLQFMASYHCKQYCNKDTCRYNRRVKGLPPRSDDEWKEGDANVHGVHRRAIQAMAKALQKFMLDDCGESDDDMTDDDTMNVTPDQCTAALKYMRKSVADGSGKSTSLKPKILYQDIRKCISNSSDDNSDAQGSSLYVGGAGKRQLSRDGYSSDDISMHAKHARLYEYYHMHMRHERERRLAMLKDHNPINDLNQNDYYTIKTYVDDYENGLIPNGGDTHDIRLKTPFSCLLVGKSKSGKTTLLLDILEQWRSYTTDESGEYEKRLYWIYGTENAKDFHKVNDILTKNFENYGENEKPKIEFFKGDFKNAQVIQRIQAIPETSIIILDDLMAEMVKCVEIANVLTRESHHRKWNVFLLWQDMFPQDKFARTISMQCDYKYIFRDPARTDRLRYLCQQMFPRGNEARDMFERISTYFDKAGPHNYPYIRITLRPDAPRAMMVLANDLIPGSDASSVAHSPSIDSGHAESLASRPGSSTSNSSHDSDHSEYIPENNYVIQSPALQPIYHLRANADRPRTPGPAAAHYFSDENSLSPAVVAPLPPASPPLLRIAGVVPPQLQRANVQVRPAAAAPALAPIPQPIMRPRGGAPQRVRARPVAGHNFYNAAFIDSLRGLSPDARIKAKRMRVNLRKNWITRYLEEHRRAIPAQMHSPAPDYAAPPPGSPIPIDDDVDINDFQAPPPIIHQPLLPQPPAVPRPIPPSLPPHNAPGGDDDMDNLLRHRDYINARNNIRQQLDNYCASDRSQADLKIFNRDYLQSVGQFCSDAL